MANEIHEQLRFEAWVPIEKAIQEENGDVLISGPVADPERDFDGELLKLGVWKGLETHFKLGGQVDWNHLWNKMSDPDTLIGSAVSKTLVDGVPWITVKLRKGLALTAKIVKMFNDGMKLGFSVQGSGERNAADPSIIERTNITMVTLAPQPKGFNQFVQMGAAPPGLMTIAKALTSEEEPAEEVGFWEPIEYEKALTTGAGIVESGAEGGQALRKQSMLSGVGSASFGGESRKEKKDMKDIRDDDERDDEKDEKSGKGSRYDDKDKDEDQGQDNDPDEDDAGDDDGSLEKAVHSLSQRAMTGDMLASIVEVEVSKAVEPLAEMLNSIQEALAAQGVDIKKSISAAKTINGNVMELGTGYETLTKAIGSTNAEFKKAIDAAQVSKAVDADDDARTIPAAHVNPGVVKSETILEKSVALSVDEEASVAKMLEDADNRMYESEDIAKALTRVYDARNANDAGAKIDVAPLLTDLKKALG